MSIELIHPVTGEISAEPSLSLDLPAEQSFDDWCALGRKLCGAGKVINWWIGDWWASGQHRYGVRARAAAEGIFGREYQTLVNCANVATKFEPNRRRLLSFSHHAEVAALPSEEADAFLDRVEAEDLSTRALRALVNQRKVTVGEQPSSDTCTTEDLHRLIMRGSKFGTIYADPPWLYDNQGTRAATGNHYGGMTVAELCELPVRELAADSAHLHLWTTNAFLFDCQRIFEAWGFEYRSAFVWVKPQLGIGNYWRNSHGDHVTVETDGRVLASCSLDEPDPNPDDPHPDWTDAAFRGATRELIDLLRLVPGGKAALATHVARFPVYRGKGVVGA